MANNSSSLGFRSIYQLFTGRSENANLIDHSSKVLERLKMNDWKTLFSARGFGAVYLLGLFDNRGPILVTEEENRELSLDHPSRLPSPFALVNHSGVNPALGKESELKSLIKTIQAAGGKVIVDFVPNHTGTTHPWIKDHPEYYHCTADFGLVHEFSGDVVKLNYEDPGLRAEQTAVLEFMESLGVDAVRCDMAHMVPNYFWSEATSTLKARRKDFLFIAEAYTDDPFDWSPLEGLIDSGFDAVYHELLYRSLKGVFEWGNPLDYLAGHLDYVCRYPRCQNLVHYLANHDDPLLEAIEPFQEALLTLFRYLPGTSLVYNGQLSGMTRRLKHHQFDFLPEAISEFKTVPSWYEAILAQPSGALLKSIWHRGDGVLEGVLEDGAGKGKIYLNFGRAEKEVVNGQMLARGRALVTI